MLPLLELVSCHWQPFPGSSIHSSVYLWKVNSRRNEEQAEKRTDKKKPVEK
jgi:hypothetical protein